MTTFLALLFVLVAAHAWVDFSVQTDTIAVNKNRRARTHMQCHVPWYYWMAAHALTHGLAVTVVLGCAAQVHRPDAGHAAWGLAVWCGASETVAHFFQDVAKCEGLTNIHVDQIGHLAVKGWFAALWAGPLFS